jgi:hypothetical protein
MDRRDTYSGKKLNLKNRDSFLSKKYLPLIPSTSHAISQMRQRALPLTVLE